MPKGRDEDKLGFTMEWVRYHDRYGTDEFAGPDKPYWPVTESPSSTTCSCAVAEAPSPDVVQELLQSNADILDDLSQERRRDVPA